MPLIHATSQPLGEGELPPLEAMRAVAEATTYDYVLLHSSPAGHSVLAFDPIATVHVDAAGRVAVDAPRILDKKFALETRGPLEALEESVKRLAFVSPHPLVGWAGFISYDVGGFLEKIPAHAADELHWPVLRFSLYRHYVLFAPGAAPTTYRLEVPPSGGFPAGLEHVLHLFSAKPPQSATPNDEGGGAGIILDAMPRTDFEKKVERVRDYIAAGDIYQANLAQRWTAQVRAKPHVIFERLCEISPAPYSACIRFGAADEPGGTRHVLSASPELFLQIVGGRAVTRPIKGTRPRDLRDPARDAALREELVDSAKDRAELTMIVDLLRNDLGRVSKFGTVQVTEERAIEQHPTVWHTVATVESELREDVGLAELLAAVCPGGSITGAPKIRAMQIIGELEGFRRGLYCGNIGVISPDARPALMLNIAIRTILMQEGKAYVYAGGGIVADSDPPREYEETLHKAAAMMGAMGVVGHTVF